jgi:CRISPR-associated endonuclease/helicase Cas3
MSEHAVGGQALTAAEFPAFVRAVHGYDPFPWQADLVTQVLSTGRWPDLVDVPTGLGKTTMIDVSVFIAAATAHQSGPDRLGRRRCFFVVDRRLVVDEAYGHALTVSRALSAAERERDPGVSGRVAAGLRAYAPDAGGDLLPVTRMRGGVAWSSAWLDRPDRPGIVLGTVDQVGSRMLFRGYGVSDRRRPIDAALTGTDALLLVDEAHLATALLCTLTAAHERDSLGVPLAGLSVVRLSATGTPSEVTFTLDPQTHRGDDEAWRRLTAEKTLETRLCAAKDSARVLATAAVEQLAFLAGLAAPDVAPRALVVCNTVDRARAVHDQVRKLLSGPKAAVQADCDLLIGRSRPIDRPALQDRVLARFGVNRQREHGAAVLVATQTVEVGVNLDADVLITESASWDALVQRLGRLNRLGRFTQRFPGASAAVVVVVHDGQDNGPVYGAARDATWEALNVVIGPAAEATIDVSPLACRALGGPLGAAGVLRAPTAVPVLLRPTLDAWVQTAPVPLLDPPIEAFLHGFDAGAAPVQMLWRHGLLTRDGLDDPFSDDGAELPTTDIAATLTHFPPRTAEIVEVPWHAVRQWMRGQPVEAISDLETEPVPDDRERANPRDSFRALALRPTRTPRGRPGDDTGPERQWQWIDADQLRPADQIIVPAERGGLDRYGWAPLDQSTVRDASEPATFQPSQRPRTATLRLDHALIQRLGLPADADIPVAELLTDEDARSGARLQEIGRHLADLLPAAPPPDIPWPAVAWQRLHAWLTSDNLRIIEILDATSQWTVDGSGPATRGWLLSGPVPEPNLPPAEASPDRDDEEAAASSVGTRLVTLDVHQAAVRERCIQIAAALRLPAELGSVLADAAGWHDLGKSEERFQIMLRGGDAYAALIAVDVLAKSGLDPLDRQAWRRAAQLSGLPAGARHEAWSAALVAEFLQRRVYPGDTDLLIHLVAAHHGYARPFARLVADPAPRDVGVVIDGEKVSVRSERTVDLDQPARFARLNQRYGRWGLALLESIVRCADMTISEEGS